MENDLDLMSSDLYVTKEDLANKLTSLEEIIFKRFNLTDRKELFAKIRSCEILEDDIIQDWIFTYSWIVTFED